jgi:MFS family permease
MEKTRDGITPETLPLRCSRLSLWDVLAASRYSTRLLPLLSLARPPCFLFARTISTKSAARAMATEPYGTWKLLLSNRIVLFLLLSVGAFHLTNAPILPMTALYIKELGGSDWLTTFTVLSAQTLMVPVAWVTGKLCDSWGRKPTLAIAFWVLPARIISYTLAHSPHTVVFLQALDGIGAGIYGVAIVAFAADLTRGKGYFNTLIGVFATAQAVGGVVGPFVQGLLLQYFGFRIAFLFFAALALAGALLYQRTVPETAGHKGNVLRPIPAIS